MSNGGGLSRIITLTTDFGLKDPYVAMIKGEILKINPEARIVDISHGIDPGDVTQAAVVVDMAARHFPASAIHVCVVDPGVGSARKPIMVITDDHYFIGPDNGVFTLIFRRDYTLFKVLELNESHFFASDVSPVFHGRDVFGRVAGWMSKGIDSSRFGSELTAYNKLGIPEVRPGADGTLEGTVLYTDRFGNTATTITKEDLEKLRGDATDVTLHCTVKGTTISGLNEHFAERKPGEPGMLVNSTGRLEFFVNRGSAQRTLGVKAGETVSAAWR